MSVRKILILRKLRSRCLEGRTAPIQPNIAIFTRAQPRRITIDEAVDGLAQPRLALTSTFLTWRQPPSR
jgi:hypothetical protein